MAKIVWWLTGLSLPLTCAAMVSAQTAAPPASPPVSLPPVEAVTIHDAAMNGDLAKVRALLERNPALLEARDDGENVTPLAYAAGFGHMEVLEYLVARGADVNARDPRGLTALHLTVYTGQLQALRYLLDKGADVKAKGPSGMVALHWANRGSADVVRLLIERKAEIDARNDYGNTPLILAVREGNREVVTALVEGGADVNAANPLTGDGPLDVAVQGGRTEVAAYLKGKGAKPRSEPAKPLRGPYLGQTPPGSTPVVFARNVVSTDDGELNSVFTPDGREFYFTRQRRVRVVRQENGAWVGPQPLPVLGDRRSVDMFVTRDGGRMYLCSAEPLAGAGEPRKDRDIWVLSRQGNGWGNPRNLGESVNSATDDLYPTLTTSGDLYFCSRRDGGKGEHDIYRSRMVEGRFQRPENLGSPVNGAESDFDPLIAADGSYLVFASTRPGGLGNADLYVSFRGKDGSWSEPRNLGAPVNTPYLEYSPMLSPDGKYLFFTSGRDGADDIYWVDARVIDAFRPRS